MRLVLSAVVGLVMLANTCLGCSYDANSTLKATNFSQYIFYKDAWHEAIGNPQQSWLAYDSAYSAQTIEFPFAELKAGGASVCEVKLKVIWRAYSASAYTGIGLFACPSLSNAASTTLDTQCAMLAYFAGNNYQWSSATPGCGPAGDGPRPCLVWITDIFNQLIQDGSQYYGLTIGTYGNGSNGPLVYDVELNIVWN